MPKIIFATDRDVMCCYGELFDALVAQTMVITKLRLSDTAQIVGRAAENNSDALVLDSNQNGDYDHVLLALRKTGLYIPTVVLGAFEGVGHLVNALNLGADQYITAKHNSAVVIAAIHAAIHSYQRGMYAATEGVGKV